MGKNRYLKEREYVKKSFIRLRGRLWFQLLVFIPLSLLAFRFVLALGNLMEWVYGLASESIAQGNYLPNNWLSGSQWWAQFLLSLSFSSGLNRLLSGQFGVVTDILMIALLSFFAWGIIRKWIDWHNKFADKTNNLVRFSTLREVNATYKMIPDRNKRFPGEPGQPVLHVSAFYPPFWLLHPLLALKTLLKWPIGLTRRTFPKYYQKLRPQLIDWMPSLFDGQELVKGGFQGYYYVDPDKTHSKTTGLTRSSKDQMRGYPLLDIISRAEVPWNVLDTDAKNEDAKMSYKALREANYDVRLVNIFEPSSSESWNPLQVALDYALDGELDAAQVELIKVAQIIGQSDQGGNVTGGQDIWDQSAQTTLVAFMLCVLQIAIRENKPELFTMSNVVSFITDMTQFNEPKKGIYGLTEYLLMIGRQPKTTLNNMITQTAGVYLGATGETRSSIYFTVMNRLRLFVSESITRLTTLNTLSLQDIGFPRRLKLHFGSSYANQHISIVIYKDNDRVEKQNEYLSLKEKKKRKVKNPIAYGAIEFEKLTLSPEGVLNYPIQHHLPEEFEILLRFDNEGNDWSIKDQQFILPGHKYQRKGLNGKIKLDEYSKKPLTYAALDPIIASDDVELPEVTLTYTEKPQAVFVITPQDNQEFASLASLFISQVYSVNTFLASKITRRKLDTRILYKLNEFSMFPSIPGFADMMTKGLTYGQQIDLYIQTLEQPAKHYSKVEVDEINGNTANWFHILTNDDKTNEALSKELGEIEVQTEIVNSQIGNAAQDKGNRQVSVKKVPLLSPQEISQLSPREMITVRTIKRRDLRGRDVRPIPIFAHGDSCLPMAYELIGKRFSLDYFTADLNIRAQHNQLTYQDLHADFTPYYEQLRQIDVPQALQEINAALDKQRSGAMQVATNEEEALHAFQQDDAPFAEGDMATFPADPTSETKSEFQQWQDELDMGAPFMTDEQLADDALVLKVEQSIRAGMGNYNHHSPEQNAANQYLRSGTFLRNRPDNNTNEVVFNLLNRQLPSFWEIAKQLRAGHNWSNDSDEESAESESSLDEEHPEFREE
ncbi:type IV secretory system conjugative DNA transfer family protein [Fructobacillus fructosus]|uniref:type IV secretory system conjugative DNA transfer family protein n=1 Tax=Fructobacillus fructosus TaxID=1631 RepID=UPI0016589EE3|nr:type IV secretory system conjugative DNA transfer family protein [Fructobacillus fructosus]MBC9119279.1 type IV secretory system conjugative DNA transfer family protein [Fructobacillus fructosus]MBD9366965.1 type IV secretory system conjugative DNA transfer family protein [Leuconostoc mesenteroides]